MKRFNRRLATVVAFLFLLIPAIEAAEQTETTMNFAPLRSDSMTVWQARRAITNASKYAGAAAVSHYRYPVYYPINASSMRLTFDNLEFDGTSKKGDTQHFMVAFKDLVRLSEHCSRYGCSLNSESGKPFYIQDAEAKSYTLSFGWEPGTGPSVRGCRMSMTVYMPPDGLPTR